MIALRLKFITGVGAAFLGLVPATTLAGHQKPSGVAPAKQANSIVGVWIVQDETAPFPFQMYVFNAYGTM